MNHVCFRISLVWLFFGSLVASAERTGAAESQPAVKPSVVVSLASIDRLRSDIAYLGQSAGTPQLESLISFLAAPYVELLNQKLPAGLLLNFDGDRPTGVAFLPITNWEKVLKKIRDQAGEPQDMGSGVKKLALPRREVFLKEQGGWLLVADRLENLAVVPGDPSAVLGSLPATYQVAVQVNTQSVPPNARKKVMSRLREEFEQSLQRQLSRTPERDRELLSTFRRSGYQRLVSAMQDAEQLTVGWAVDQQTRKTYLDFSVIATEGSQLARQLEELKTVRSEFAGFSATPAAVTLYFATRLPREESESWLALLQEARRRAEAQIDKDPNLAAGASRTLMKEAMELLIDPVAATLRQGRVDGGAALVVSPGAIQFVAGARIVDGVKIEDALRKVVEVAKTRPRLPEIRFDVENYKKVELHTLDVPVPERDGNARRLLGEQMNIVVGTAPSAVYLAFGRECVTLLKQVIDASEASGPADCPTALKISLAPILDAASSLGQNAVISFLAEAIKKSPGKDHVTLTTRSVDRGIVSRLEVEEGVLQLIGGVLRARGAENRGR